METKKVKSHLFHEIEKAEEKARYDESAKELLKDKQVYDNAGSGAYQNDRQY